MDTEIRVSTESRPMYVGGFPGEAGNPGRLLLLSI